MKRGFRLFSLILLLCIHPLNAHADNVSSCTPALIASQEHHDYVDNVFTRILLLQILDDQTYEQLRSKARTGGSVVYDGIPIDANLDYSQFIQRAQQLYSQYSLDVTSSEALTWSKTFLSPQASKIYSDCLKALRPLGVHVYPIYASPDDTSLIFEIALNSDPGATVPVQVIPLHATLVAGQDENLKVVPTGSTVQVAIERQNLDTPAAVLVNVPQLKVNPNSDHVEFPKRPRLKIQIEVSSDIGQGIDVFLSSLDDKNYSSPMTACAQTADNMHYFHQSDAELLAVIHDARKVSAYQPNPMKARGDAHRLCLVDMRVVNNDGSVASMGVTFKPKQYLLQTVFANDDGTPSATPLLEGLRALQLGVR